MSTERPGFTNGTETVALGHIQLELGYAYEKDEYQKGYPSWLHRYLDTSQIRVPLDSRVEVRVGIPVYYSFHGTYNSQVGWGDSSLSFKCRFLDGTTRRPSLAVIAGTSLPTGSDFFSANRVLPSVDLEAEYELSPLWQLQANASVTRVYPPNFTQYAGAINLGYNISNSASVFIETYRITPLSPYSSNSSYVDGGVTYRITPITQIDFNAGIGIAPGVRGDHFLGAGIARRW